MKPETERWLDTAKRDLDDARLLLEENRLESAAFHAQQAAEKALKAILVEHAGRFPRVHNLVTLAGMVKAPEDIVTRCRTITPAYVAFRYPDVGEAMTLEDAEEIVRSAEEVLAWCRKRI